MYTAFINQLDTQCLDNIVSVITRSNQDYIQDMLANENGGMPEEDEEEEDDE